MDNRSPSTPDKCVIDDDDMDSDTRHKIKPFVKVRVILAHGE